MIDFVHLGRSMNLYIHAELICTSKMFSDSESSFEIFWQEGISHSTRGWLPHISNSRALFLTTLPWYHDAKQFLKQAEFIRAIVDSSAGTDPLPQFMILCNAPEEVDFAREAGFKHALLCNHNSFLDSNIYTLECNKFEHDRSYDLVLNCRPERWKRPFFAMGIDRLAVIKGHNFRPNDYFDLATLNPMFINSNRLSAQQVVGLLNDSRVGGIFSAIEGGCYSSSEYLLCGLPVVSTTSKGGRDVWYDVNNSIIVNAPSEVAPAVTVLAERCKNRPELRAEIRSRHIAFATEMRSDLFTYVDSIAAGYGLNICFAEIFDGQYVNKVTKYTKFVQCT